MGKLAIALSFTSLAPETSYGAAVIPIPSDARRRYGRQLQGR
jgi:hypothetical protein